MNVNSTFYTIYGKRIFDLVLTLPGILMISPIMLMIALLVRCRIGRPVFFKQNRPGLHGKSFTIYKFRTMTDARNAEGILLPDHNRITDLGHFLRKTSMDELPELFNVLKGDMSLVGPRPLLLSYLPYYSEREQRRHLVKPGITGQAQISGRNFLNWDERLEIDVLYVEKHSFSRDIQILFKTFMDVFFSKGVAVDSSSIEPSLIDYKLNKAYKKND